MSRREQQTNLESPNPESLETLHDWTADQSIGYTIIDSVSTLTETSFESMGTLYESIDADALDSLLAPSRNQSPCRVTFRYEGCEVTITSSGRVSVTQTDV